MKIVNDFGVAEFKNKMELEDELIGRIVKQTHHTYSVATTDCMYDQVKQKLSKSDKKKGALTSTYVVGDFVSLEKTEEHMWIKECFKRKNVLSKAKSQAKKTRKVQEKEQLVASNVDHVFLTLSTDQRFTLSKLERYLVTFTEYNIKQTVLITKSDFSEQADYLVSQIAAVYPELDILRVSALKENGIKEIKQRLIPGTTTILIGASGAGKSTIINKLVGAHREKTNDVRVDGKGKHTTTYSTIIPIPDTGSYIIDTPGIKSIATTKKTKEDTLFSDIIDLAKDCKFRDCHHLSEPKCAVKKAVELGELDEQRLARYRKVNGI